MRWSLKVGATDVSEGSADLGTRDPPSLVTAGDQPSVEVTDGGGSIIYAFVAIGLDGPAASARSLPVGHKRHLKECATGIGQRRRVHRGSKPAARELR